MLIFLNYLLAFTTYLSKTGYTQKLVIGYVYVGEKSKAEISLMGTFTKHADCLSEQD